MKKADFWQKVAQAVRNVIFLAVLVLLYFALSSVMELKKSAMKYEPFYRADRQYDVLYFGTSHVRNGFLPMELWEKYGITSYNFGNDSMEIAASYWSLMSALDYAQPALVIVDVAKLDNNRYTQDAAAAHKLLDAMPLSGTKLRAVEDLFGPCAADMYGNNMAHRWSDMLWSFALYHNRWTELTQEDFAYEVTGEKGAKALLDVAAPAEYVLVPAEDMTQLQTVAVRYLRKMIEECQRRNIAVLLTYLPGTVREDIQRRSNFAAQIAQEYGIPFLNFMYEENLLNYETDFNDVSPSGCHLNASGAKKLTTYLGKYIAEQYAIADKRGDEAYQGWAQDYAAYAAEKRKHLAETDNLKSYLVQIADKNYDICIRTGEGSDVLKNKRLLELVQNLTFRKRIDRFLNAVSKKRECWLYVDNLAKTAETSFDDSVAGGAVYWEADEQIAVLDAVTKEVIDTAQWYLDPALGLTRKELLIQEPAQ